MAKVKVNWYPTHPTCRSVSMAKYWRLLYNEIADVDPYACKSLIKLPATDWAGGRSTMKVGVSRKLVYPLRVKAAENAALGHILDHDWADLIKYMPDSMAKVVTVHDLIPLRYRGELRDVQLKRFSKRVSYLREADLIICVSKYTANEVNDLLGISFDKMVVVPNGVALPPNIIKHTRVNRIVNRVPAMLRIGCLGSTQQRKNLAILPDALKYAIAELGDPVTMVRAGPLVDPTLHERFVNAVGVDHFIELGRLDDDELEDFYDSVDVIVVPSLYEGFGLPVLEAMARGVPVISSDSSSLPEVAGDAPLYFDPYKPEELAVRLVQVVDKEVSEHIKKRGLERAKEFSWRSTLDGIYSAYDQVLKL